MHVCSVPCMCQAIANDAHYSSSDYIRFIAKPMAVTWERLEYFLNAYGNKVNEVQWLKAEGRRSDKAEGLWMLGAEDECKAEYDGDKEV